MMMWIAACCIFIGAATMIQAAEDLNGAEGMIFRADVENRTFELLKETVIDPKTDEGRSRHTIHWNDKTQFVRVDRQNSFEGIDGIYFASIKPVDQGDMQKTTAGESILTLDVDLQPLTFSRVHLLPEKTDSIVGNFKPNPNSERQRNGEIKLENQTIPVRLRGPRAKVDLYTIVDEATLHEGFWATKIFGERDEQGHFVANRIELFPREDPRTTDDPNLPRVLVIGDSISMNYHEAAKQALEGIANYHRIEGNAGPADRGAVCVELWLGDYTQPGLHWDVIQFNHGLHDLKQLYDQDTQTYGDYLVDLENYKANLEIIIESLKQTGATLMWCSTTPVPQSSVGIWDGVKMGRKHGADLIFNEAALQVIQRHPDILLNDLNTAIRESEGFEAWWQGKDVHFWSREEQQIVGEMVAQEIQRALQMHADRQSD